MARSTTFIYSTLDSFLRYFYEMNLMNPVSGTINRTMIYTCIAYCIMRKMKYRSRTEICSNILQSANGGATKTKIMYKAFLSYSQLKEYLAVLIENDLLASGAQETGIYRTTDKGLKFLQTTEELGGLLEIPKTI